MWSIIQGGIKDGCKFSIVVSKEISKFTHKKDDMARYKKIPFEKVAEVYSKKAGNVSSTCSALGIDRNTFMAWREKYPKLAQLLDEVDESLIDFSESKLLEQINAGNLTAIIFHLKTKGKKRGYVESVEQNLNVNPFEKLMQELPDDEE